MLFFVLPQHGHGSGAYRIHRDWVPGTLGPAAESFCWHRLRSVIGYSIRQESLPGK